MSKLVIIGNGVTGATLAKRVRELDSEKEIVLISNESPYFFSRPALMYIYMGHMTEKQTRPFEDHKWDDWKISRLQTMINSIDYNKKHCLTDTGEKISYDELVIASGSKPNKFGWPGQDLEAVQGLYSLQDLYSMEKWSSTTKRAVIVGGGLIGVEMAEMFLTRGIEVTFLVREKEFWNTILPVGESRMVAKHMAEHHVDLRPQTELKEIHSDENGRVGSITTSTGEKIDCEFVGLTAGVSPNIDAFKDSDLNCDRGVLIDRQLQTNIENVYAAGDCAQFTEPYEGRRPIEQVWYTGKNQAMILAEIICKGDVHNYIPGIWFNSAKFFDIEYQTYGTVMGKLPEGEDTLFWQDKNGKRSFRVNYLKGSKTITGFNFMGIRGRHLICEQWLSENKTVEYVLTNLGALNFDPEFYTLFESSVINEYNTINPESKVSLKTKKGLFSKLFRTLEEVK